MDKQEMLQADELMLDELDQVVGGAMAMTLGAIDDNGARHLAKVDISYKNGVKYVKFLEEPDDFLVEYATTMQKSSKGKIKFIDYSPE